MVAPPPEPPAARPSGPPAAGRPALVRELLVDLVQAHRRALDALATLLRTHGLSEPQFNVLRILRGAGPPGLPCLTVGERLVSRVPDVTRLVDRLQRAGLVSRTRPPEDRRKVLVALTPAGRALLEWLDEPVEALFQSLAGTLEDAELVRLRELLRRFAPARESPGADPAPGPHPTRADSPTPPPRR